MLLKRKLIKNLGVALKAMESMVKEPRFLQNGRDFKNFSLRPREVWANWLLCAVLQKIYGKDITFGEDTESDGIFLNKETGQWILAEHVSALDTPSKQNIPKGEARIIKAINHKINEGPEYAKNKILIVFFDGAGNWYRNKVRENIRGRHNFMAIIGIGLLTSSDKDGYAYSVTEFYENDSITFKININKNFTNWTVSQIL